MRAALLCLAVCLTACSGDSHVAPPHFFGPGATTPHVGGTLHLSLSDDVRTLDPAIAFDEYSTMMARHIFGTLLDYDSAFSPDPLKLQPDLAESWSISDDGRTYSFTLRPGLAYSDGQPIVAGDFVYAIDRVLDPATGSGGAQFLDGITGAKDVTAGKSKHADGLRAIDDRHLEIHLDQPDSIFAMLLAIPFTSPMKASYVAQVGKRIVDQPLASGAFMVQSWNRGSKLVFVKNPHYWDAAHVYLDGIVVNLIIPRDVAVLKFLAGETDAIDRLASDDYLRFLGSPAWQPYLVATHQMGIYGESMNVRMKPFDDKRVRQAMNYAFNKDDTVKLYNGRAVVAHGILPQNLPEYDPSVPPYPYDPAKARQLLAEAGYPNGFDIAYSTLNDEMAIRLGQSLQADLAKVGVRMSIQIMTFPAYLTAAGRGELAFNYSGWAADFPDAWDFLWSRFDTQSIIPENANNDSGYSNPAFDFLVENGRREMDPAKRLVAYRKAEAILYEDCPWIWHYYPIQVEVRQPYLRNYRPHPIWLRDYRHAWLDEPVSEKHQ